jgi:hypothetical protein
VCLIPRQPKAGPWKLADGSELSLAGVTYGKHHTMRYGDRFVDYLYPVLPDLLRKKFGCKVATLTSVNSNTIVLWFWDKDAASLRSNVTFTTPQYFLATLDEQGLEAVAPFYPEVTVVSHRTNVMQGVELLRFPRRSPQFGVRIFREDEPLRVVAEFKVMNRIGTNYPSWQAEPLPATRKTNGLEVTLNSFTTGTKTISKVFSGRNAVTELKSRAAFVVKENGKSADQIWRIDHVSATAPTGEMRLSISENREPGQIVLYFQDALWAEEPAWNLRATLRRTANFPDDELWTVKGVVIPAEEQIRELNLKTNIYGSEIELVAMTGRYLHMRSPLPASDTHLELLSVKDEHGREVSFMKASERPGTGGRGATIRELEQIYRLEIHEGTRTVDITLAYTKSFMVEFMAKPTVVR